MKYRYVWHDGTWLRLPSLANASGSPVPGAVTGINNAIAASAGQNHTCAVLGGGTVQCWGLNSGGQLGRGNMAFSDVPVTVSAF